MVRSRAEITTPGSRAPLGVSPRPHGRCRSRSSARPPQMGAIRRPLLWTLRAVGGSCLSPSLHFLSGHLASLTVISLLFFSLQRLLPTCANMCKRPESLSRVCAHTAPSSSSRPPGPLPTLSLLRLSRAHRLGKPEGPRERRPPISPQVLGGQPVTLVGCSIAPSLSFPFCITAPPAPCCRAPPGRALVPCPLLSGPCSDHLVTLSTPATLSSGLGRGAGGWRGHALLDPSRGGAGLLYPSLPPAAPRECPSGRTCNRPGPTDSLPLGETEVLLPGPRLRRIPCPRL